MISIIIASINAEFLKNVSQNISDTIGVDFEIISFDNSKGEKGLCEIYNMGIAKAKNNLLCFMHEDVEFKTKDWGLKVKSFFEEHQDAGLLGIAGSKYKAAAPSGWHVESLKAERSNIIQKFKFNDKSEHHHQINPDHLTIEKVAVLDGVWLCTTKKVLSKFKFDESTFKKFHGYDIDLSIQIGSEYKVFVTYEILLRHFSEGNFNKEWLLETIKLHKKWTGKLPINKGDFTERELIIAEKHSFKLFIRKLIENEINLKEILNYLWSSKGFNYLSLVNFIKINFMILKRGIK